MNNVFEDYSGQPEIRNLQIVYLREVLGYTPTQIAKYVKDIAVATIKSYMYKFRDLLDKAKEFFGDKAKKLIDKVKEKCNVTNTVTYECDHKKAPCAYIIEYFDSQHNFCFLKVGMTNNIQRRITEHLRDYCKPRKEKPDGWDTTYAVVKNLYYAEDEEDALTLENLLRKHYKKIKNNGFIKRDRFEFVRYDKNELEQDEDIMQKVQMFAV